ncbi:hypothetical protein JCM33374_g789 [Metschnikowia sp. JCM 33374]|nr:hypothetical protein JCM33374_g789 [Metschnikowia sp. JCM 33374]
MRLKLQAKSTDVLKSCFSQINTLRKRVILRFSPEQLLAISINSSSLVQEPQIWCKFPMQSIFQDIEIQSIRDNVISLEINIELFLQALRNFDKSNSHELSIRLQKKDGEGSSKGTYLALYYSGVSENASTISHTFRIPVKVMKSSGEKLKEPVLPRIDLMMRLPNEFSATYRRLEKFKNSTEHETVTINASRRNGGLLKFILQEADSCSTSIRWNDKLDIQKPPSNLNSDSLRTAAFQDSHGVAHDDDDSTGDVKVTVNLKDWCMAAKIVNTCKTIIFFMCDNHACVIHCMLDDTDDAEVVYYISGVKQTDFLSD